MVGDPGVGTGDGALHAFGSSVAGVSFLGAASIGFLVVAAAGVFLVGDNRRRDRRWRAT